MGGTFKGATWTGDGGCCEGWCEVGWDGWDPSIYILYIYDLNNTILLVLLPYLGYRCRGLSIWAYNEDCLLDSTHGPSQSCTMPLAL